ncbi:deoxycytidylate deaminase [Xanthomonas phage XacN1]|nr:deoxycytidylate deaminase [Xanthomonas phage XacN1]
MKPLPYNAPFLQIMEAAVALEAKRPDYYKVDITKVKYVGRPEPSDHRSLKLVTPDDAKLIIDDYSEFPFDVDCVGENEEFIDRLNGFIAKEFPPEIDWDRRFLKMAAGEINTWSKDPSTKVSATIFRGKYPIAASYNGFPPGIEDTYERLNNRELKYKLVQHAEANAIATCSKLGISTEGTTMAVTHFPCSTCAGLMIGAGIKKVVVQEPNADFLSRWKDSVELSKEMFAEAGVELVVIDLNKD